MCDTLGKITSEGALFAKNSDRSPNEVQVLEYHPAQTGLSGRVSCTYLSIPQAEKTHAVLLSRPHWMWGAEMGVNDRGLCIGNEAVFTKGAYGKTGLTGMDLVRLGLERCDTAKEALTLLMSLLETYGQGGNCGFDHDFYYDNAFLLMDRQELYVLETAGKHWTYKRYPAAGISNGLSIGADADGYSGGKCYDFRKRYTEPVYTTFSASAKRRAQTESCLSRIDSVSSCIQALQQHADGLSNPFARGSVGSVCMHYGGLVGDHSTSSMVVDLEKPRPVVWSTGSSVPCVSLFKPWLFGTQPKLPVVLGEDPEGKTYWLEEEGFRRSLLGKTLPEEYHIQHKELQSRWIALAENLSEEAFPEFSQSCLAQERAFFSFWRKQPLETCRCAPGFRSRWAKKTRVLKQMHEEFALK